MIPVRAQLLLLMAVAFLGAGSFVMSMLWLYVPSAPAYVALNPHLHSARVEAGVIVFERYFRITRPGAFEITRELRRTLPGGKLLTITLPSTIVSYEAGDYAVERPVPIPLAQLTPGEYQIQNTVSWQANPLRRDSVVLPVLSLTIE